MRTSLLLTATLAACVSPSVRRGAPPPSDTPVQVAEIRAVSVGPWNHRRGAWASAGPVMPPTVLWRTKVDGPVIHPLSTDGTAIYVVAAGRIQALALDGTRRWESRISASGPAMTTAAGPGVGTDEGAVAIFDAERGSLVDKYTGGGAVRGGIGVVGGVPAWVTVDGIAVGAGGWLVEAAYSAAGGVASDEERIYFSTLEGELFAIAPSGTAWRSSLPGPGMGHPVLDEDRVYASYGAVGGRPGGVAAFARSDGAELWTWRGSFEPGAPPALDEHLLLPERNGQLHAIDPSTGALRWSAEADAELTVSPVIGQQGIYVGTADGRVLRIDRDDGGIVWSVSVGAAVTGDPVLVGDRLVVGLASGEVVMVGSTQ